jgi:hypothetical protein
MSNTRRTLLIILIMAVLLSLGLVMVLAMKMLMTDMEPKNVSMETGAVIVALLILLLAFVILSGAIAEFGFGGVKAKFNRAADAGMTLPEPGKMLPTADDFDQVGQEGSAVTLMGGLI